MPSRALLPAVAVALVALVMAGCGYPDPTPTNGPAADVGATTPTPSPGTSTDGFNEGNGKTSTKLPDGLQYVDLKVGTGPVVPAKATVNVQYTGWLSNGTQFDTSRQPGRDVLCAVLAATDQQNGNCTPVIPGWNEGVPGMKVGGRRKMTLPPALGYGSQGSPPVIPANATLVFTVEVVSIVTTVPPPAPVPSPT